MASRASPVYFELSQGDLAHLPSDFGPFETHLLSALAGIFEIGLIMNGQKLKETLIDLDKSSPLAITTKKFIKLATKSHCNGDKFISLRLSGPSLQYMKAQLPLTSLISLEKHLVARNILQILLWRTFAVGNKDHLRQLTFSNITQPMVKENITKLIISWINNKKLLMSVYGNLMINKDQVGEIVEKYWSLAEHLAQIIEKFVRAPPQQQLPTFEDVYNHICASTIPSIPRGGLLVWLLTSDFSEYKVCSPPSVNDLAKHIAFAKTSGPSVAMKLVKEWSGETTNKVSDKEAVVKIMNVFEDPLY